MSDDRLRRLEREKGLAPKGPAGYDALLRVARAKRRHGIKLNAAEWLLLHWNEQRERKAE